CPAASVLSPMRPRPCPCRRANRPEHKNRYDRENHLRPRSSASIAPLLAPVHILILSVIVVPSIYVVWLSLNTSSFGRAPTFVGLQNYIDPITDPAFRSALWNTVVLVVVAVHVELAIGLAM